MLTNSLSSMIIHLKTTTKISGMCRKMYTRPTLENSDLVKRSFVVNFIQFNSTKTGLIKIMIWQERLVLKKG